MDIAAGTRLGSYQIIGALGAGGMGEVWRATDTVLGRDVAIKVLPAEFSTDPERLARFEREAKVLASLNHANIAGIYGLHEHEGVRFLTMELVPGEDLAERLKRGKLPLDEALDVARQIAEALEVAHEQGIVHRDLKPANVRITPEGKVKVLDFGLAKALETAVSSSPGRDPAMSPTITSLGTMVGVVVGTAAYMSPEQARGKGVDKRADIWAFGCVLYELLTGNRAFDGETISDTLAAVLAKDANWDALPPATPAKVREVLQRCLEKDPKRRMRDIGDARIELEEVLAERTASGRVRAAAAVAVAAKPRPSSRLVVAMLGCAVLGAAIAALGMSLRSSGDADAHVMRLDLVFPADVRVRSWDLSPDGSAVAAVGSPRVAAGEAEPPPRIYVRRLGSSSFVSLPGTEGAKNAGFSADGRFVIAVLPATLGSSQFNVVRVSLDGGTPPFILSAADPHWTTGGALHDGGFVALRGGTDLVRIPAGGGAPAAPAKVDLAGEKGLLTLAPRALPGDEAILLHAIAYGAKGWYYRVGVLDIKKARIAYLFDDGGFPNYSAATKSIVFSRGDGLLAVGFDASSRKLTGSPVPLTNGVETQYAFQPALFSLSDNGVLAYVPGGRTAEGRRVGMVDASGNVSPVSDERHAYQTLRVGSPDGRRYVTTVTNGQGIDELWVGDLDRPGLRRLVAIPDADVFTPILSHDSRTVVFGRHGRNAEDGIYLKDIDDASAPRRIAILPADDLGTTLWSFAPDGSGVVAARLGADQKGDIFFIPIPRNGETVEPKPVINDPGDDIGGRLSPDGRWIEYMSDESGRPELYVGAFHGAAPVTEVIRVTRSGAAVSEGWSADGREFIYRDPGGRLIAIPITTSPSLSIGTPKVLFDAGKLNVFVYDPLSGNRHLVLMRGEEESDETTRLALTLSYTSELADKLKAGR